MVVVVIEKYTKAQLDFSLHLSYFFTSCLHQFRDPIWTLYSAHQSEKLHNWKSGHACRRELS